VKNRLYILLAALLLAAAPMHAGGIVDRVFSGGAKSLAKQTLNLNKKAPEGPGGLAGLIGGLLGGSRSSNSNTTAPTATPSTTTTTPASTPTPSTTASSGGGWTAVADSTFDTGLMTVIRAVTYGSDRFVAVGDGGKMAYSDW
jgi:hypothetical protein